MHTRDLANRSLFNDILKKRKKNERFAKLRVCICEKTRFYSEQTDK